MKIYSWLSLALMVWLAACSKPLPELKGVNIESWKADKYGCAGNREPFIETVRTQKNSLLALSEMQIVDILGKPDRTELSKRNQKYYYYYFQPGKDCQSPVLNPLRLSIRFNAVGLANEITVD